ncbi:DNA internalization-related competence protein ComEC/Rec2 [Planctomycetaceae bacterium]|jgi:competence protein ComEC|nr:DNA internalization-related competence protein ComEC/Rec2 [Planctomycetaceae bacterium]
MGGGIAFLTAISFALIRQSQKPHTLLLVIVLLLMSVGGMYHSYRTQKMFAHPLSGLSETEWTTAQMRVRLLESPHISRKTRRKFTPAWRVTDRTLFPAECLLWNGEEIEPGKILVSVRGHLIGPRAGDVVDFSGQFGRPSQPANPGEFDFQKWMALQEYLGSMSVEHPRHVEVIAESSSSVGHLMSRSRKWLADRLDQYLKSPDSRALARALLLGDRADLPDEIKRAFIQSGVFHLLAISGLHIGIIAVMLSRLLSILNLSVRRSSLMVIILMIGYASVTGLRPSVFRATLFLVIYLSGRLLGRESSPLNSLGLTAFLLVLMNPMTLFNSGSQLSFLSVLGIIAVRPLLLVNPSSHSLYERAVAGLPRPWYISMMASLRNSIYDVAVIGLAVSLFTFPVIAKNFHLFPIWGVPLTILMIPLVTVLLGLGCVLLVASLVFPVVCPALGWCMEKGLVLISSIPQSVSDSSVVTWTLADVSSWWLMGYLMFVMAILLSRGLQLRLWTGMFVWCGLHILVSQTSFEKQNFRLTTYSVGHGIAILMEFPDGKRFLYDCGSNDGGHNAARAILDDFRQRGVQYLDRVYLSHADLDHYSAFPDLLEEIEINEVVTTESLMSSSESNLQYLHELMRQSECRVQVATLGDQEVVDDEFQIEILHPKQGLRYSSDNAASLVLLLTCRGQRILLTGDVEAEGLESLMDQSIGSVDYLLSPHHGSRAANTAELAKWCRPKRVVVFSGYRLELEYLEDIYAEAEELYVTHRDGAVIIEIPKTGRVQWRTWRSQSSRTD